jgi:hypothetical protein
VSSVVLPRRSAIVPPPTSSTSQWPSSSPAAAVGDRAALPVEVRTRRADGAGPPEQILWRGRLWLVRHAERLGCRPQQSERWAVEAGDGPGGPLRALELVQLVTGTWQLHEDGA